MPLRLPRLALLALLCASGCGVTEPAAPRLPDSGELGSGTTGSSGSSGGSTGTSGTPGQVCAGCTTAAECGPGGLCLPEANGGRCATACNTDGSCPGDTQCFSVDAHDVCFPREGSCIDFIPGRPGTTDAGPRDAGMDAGPMDGGAVDGGAVDAGHLDAGPVDAGPVDAGMADAGSTSCTDDTWGNYAAGFFATWCNRCHSYTSPASLARNSTAIRSRIASGSMPKNATLPANEKARILTWLDCGRP